MTSVHRWCILATYGSVSTDGERFTDPCLAEIDRQGWTKSRSSSLISCKDVVAGFLRYNSQVLYLIVLPFIVGQQGTVLPQDNAQPHAAKLTQNFLPTAMFRHYHCLCYHPILTRLKFV